MYLAARNWLLTCALQSVFLMYSLSTSAVRRMRDYKEEAHLGEEELAALHEQAEQARIASFRVACREVRHFICCHELALMLVLSR